MRSKIDEKVKSALNGWNIDNYEISFGYDCIEIKLINVTEIPTQVVNDLEMDLQTDISWINICDGNIQIGLDISNFILQEFESWSVYEEKYGVC